MSKENKKWLIADCITMLETATNHTFKFKHYETFKMFLQFDIQELRKLQDKLAETIVFGGDVNKILQLINKKIKCHSQD